MRNVSFWLGSPFIIKRFGSKEQLLQTLEEQTHRRFIKSHLPLDAQVFSPKAKYIFVARDGRDVACSLHNHAVNFIIEGHVKPESIQDVFQTKILSKSETSFFAHVRSWWNIRHLPNVLLVHFCQLKKDLPSEIQRIAKFLEIEIDPLQWDAILEHCSFNYMKGNATKFMDNKYFVGGATTFFCQGTNGRWKNILTKEECDTYEKRALEELGEEGARWLATGQLTDETEIHD
jgi:aryl sulfotransferase